MKIYFVFFVKYFAETTNFHAFRPSQINFYDFVGCRLKNFYKKSLENFP